MTKWQKGKSGNPKGRPKGKESHSTSLRRILQERSEELINKAVDLALAGDSVALRLCIERLIPRAKEDNVSVILPDLKELPIEKIATELLYRLSGQELSISELKQLVTFANFSLEHDREKKIHKSIIEILAMQNQVKKHEKEN